MIIKRLLILALPFSLMACSSIMTAEECQNTDWRTQGLQDGQAGEYKAIFNEYVDACVPSGAKPNRDQYAAGYMQGLKEFCTEENGLERGLKGGASHNCPGDSPYHAGYNEGVAKYKEEQERREIEKLTRQSPNTTSVGAPGGQ